MSVRPLPPCRSDPKYIVPFAAIVGYHSLPGLLMGAPTFFGSPQPAVVFSITQMSRLGVAVPATGRLEMKEKREPSAVMNGSASEYCPEKGATCGVLHFPFTKCET